MNKKSVILLGLVVVIISVIAINFSWQSKKANQQVIVSPTKGVKQVTVTPTKAVEQVTVVQQDTNTKLVTFPRYNISFTIPSDFTKDTKYTGGGYPLGNTLTNSNFISSDYKENMLPVAVHGILISVALLNKDTHYIDGASKNGIDTSRSIVDIDNSPLPDNNSLITPLNTKVYSLIQDSTVSSYLFSGYFANLTLHNNADISPTISTNKVNIIQINCSEAGISTTSIACKKIVKNILVTLKVQH